VLEIPVAVKLIRDDLRVAGIAERLLLEARLAARIEHPAIVRVLGLDTTQNGAPFIVMELLEGEDLRAVLDRDQRMSAIEAVRLLLPIAGALVAAHDRGVLHRDLKPENVFIAQIHGRPQPKVVDFGIAAPLDRQRRRLTQSGAVVGSPDYLSPEQALGNDDVDQRADIWGFCAMLYECVTGYPPFARSSYDDLLTDVVHKPIPSLPDCGIDDFGLWPIVERGLTKDRELRWPDMRALGAALASFLIERGVDEDICGRSLRSDWLASPKVVEASPIVVAAPLPALPSPEAKTLILPPRPARGTGDEPEPKKPVRWHRVAVGAAALVLALACAQVGAIWGAPKPSSAPTFVRDMAPAPQISRRVAMSAPRLHPDPAPAESDAPPQSEPEKRVRRGPAQKRAPLPPGFDPLLGF
jgi:serine/threonine-protein kinase